MRRRSAVLTIAAAALLAFAGAASAVDSTATAPAPAPVPPPRVGGYLQFRELFQEHVGWSASLVRARFSVDGSLPNAFSYKLLFEGEASNGAKSAATPSLREAYARWTHAPFTLTGGQFKTPFTREYLIPITQLETADLAVAVDSLAPKYDVGVMAEYAPRPWVTASLGWFNGEGQNAIANRDSMVLVIGRLAARPVPQLGLGASATHEGADSLRYGFDGQLEQWGGLVRAEWMTRHRKGHASDKDDVGWTLFGQYRATPTIAPFVRLEDFQRPWYGPARRVRAYSAGANLDLAPTRVKLLLEWSQRRTGKLQQRTDVGIAQLQLRF